MKTFNVRNYMGTWHELARITKSYEEQCETAIAEYRWNAKEGAVDVVNNCLNSNGEIISTIHGIARPTNIPGKLSLKFDTIPLEMTYDVVWTDYKNFSIVGKKGGPLLGYFWLLGRRSRATKKEWRMLKKKVVDFGFDPSIIEIVEV
jgi:apolipoprotein D and lipocalin family protein